MDFLYHLSHCAKRSVTTYNQFDLLFPICLANAGPLGARVLYSGMMNISSGALTNGLSSFVSVALPTAITYVLIPALRNGAIFSLRSSEPKACLPDTKSTTILGTFGRDDALISRWMDSSALSIRRCPPTGTVLSTLLSNSGIVL